MDVRTLRVFQFDALEDRLCLSSAHASALHGSMIKGTIEVPASHDTTLSSPLSIKGNGRVNPFGPVSALGTLSPGTGGVIDLASGDGGVVVRLGVITPHGHAGQPRFHFAIIGGTGAFANASGEGTVSESVGNGLNTIALRFHGTLRSGS